MSDKILIVDDELELLSLLAMTLKENGFVVSQASSADEAQAIIEKDIPEIIIMDVNMPKKTGIEYAHELKQNQKYSNIPIIFLSAIEENEAMASALIMGGADYITKPFDIKEVLRKIYEALR